MRVFPEWLRVALGSDGVDINPSGTLSTINDRLVIAATDPEITSLEVTATGAGLTLGFAAAQQVTIATNANPAKVLLGVEAASRFLGPDYNSPSAVLEKLERCSATFRRVRAALPADYDIHPVFSDVEDLVTYNLQLNYKFTSPFDLDLFQKGFNLGDFEALEVAAQADATLAAIVRLDLDVGSYTETCLTIRLGRVPSCRR